MIAAKTLQKKFQRTKKEISNARRHVRKKTLLSKAALLG